MLSKSKKTSARIGKRFLQNCKNIVSILSICSIITEIRLSKIQSRFRDGVKLWKIMSCKGVECTSDADDCSWWNNWCWSFLWEQQSTIKWTGPSVILAYLIAGIFYF